MKKLTLHLHDLRVDSFAAAPAKGGNGTVMARELTPASDPTWDSCYYTCPGFATYGGPDQPCNFCG